MRKLIYFVASTLDGFIAGPDGGDPSDQPYFPVTADLLEFIVENYPETLPAPARDALGITGAGQVFDTVLEGRASYEVGLAAGLSDAYPHLRHLVFSSTLDNREPALEIVRSNALARVQELKTEPGKDLWLVGGGTLAYSLLSQIDRIVLKVNPSIIGSGIALFNGPFQPQMFEPVTDQLLSSGVRVLTYDRVGS